MNISALVFVVVLPAIAATSPFLEIDFETALSKAKVTNKTVIVEFYTDWCGPCKRMDRTTWQDKKVRDWMTKNAIPLKINAEKQLELAKGFGVIAYPTMVFVSPERILLDKMVGYHDAAQFLEGSKKILNGKGGVIGARKELAEAKDRGTGLTNYARKMGELQRYDEAFSSYMDAQKAGATTSLVHIGLARIVRNYPPASEYMIDRLEDSKNTVLAGNATGGQVLGFISIHNIMYRRGEILKVYNSLKQTNPESRALQFFSPSLIRPLLKQRRYEELERINPVEKRIKRTLAGYKKGVAGTRDKNRIGYLKIGLAFNLSQAYEQLLGLGRPDRAAKIADRILKLEKTDTTYHFLAEAGAATGKPTVLHLVWARKANVLAKGEKCEMICTLANVLYLLEQREEAVALLEDSLKFFPYGRDKATLTSRIKEMNGEIEITKE